jgi:hypothetical protein
MIQLPKKHPWILIALLYLVIVSGWVTFYILAKNHSGNKRTPEEAEALLKENQEKTTTPPSNHNDD